MNLSTLYKKLTNGKYIIGLGLTIISCLSFCNAGSYTFSGIATSSSGIPNMFPPQLGNNTNMTVHCYINSLTTDCDGGGSVLSTKFGFGFLYGSNSYGVSTNQSKPDTTYTINCGDNMSLTYDYDFSTFSPTQDYYKPYNGVYIFTFPSLWIHSAFQFSYSCTFSGVSVIDGNNYSNSSTPSCPECPSLSGYILESEIDTNYCVGNGYCPNECGSGEELTGINRSTLYINNIQYPGAPTIKFTIPEEIQREDNTDEEEVNIDVIGYGYDQDKMQQMVNTQYYKPTAEEMSGLIEKVADFLPLIAVALLIIRIRRIIKKIFKF